MSARGGSPGRCVSGPTGVGAFRTAVLVAVAGLLGVISLLGAVGPDLHEPPNESSPAFTVESSPESTRGHSLESLREPRPAPVSRIAVPVLLVPGWFDSARDLAAIRIHLVGAGWPSEHVATLTFEEPTGSNIDHADELEAAIRELQAATGANRVDVVAHSMGGLATRWYLMTRPDAPVRRVVFLGSPHRGTLSAHLAWGGGREEMMPESAFLDTLNSTAPAPEGVETITVRTVIDTHIVPGESATLPGVPDYALCCPTHAGLLRDTDVFEIVRSFLELGVVGREPSNGGGG